MVRNLTPKQEKRVQSLDWEDSLEKEMATHSSVLAWEIPWTEEPGGLLESQRVRHDIVTKEQFLKFQNLKKGLIISRR